MSEDQFMSTFGEWEGHVRELLKRFGEGGEFYEG
jgi:hypothetical protein